MPARVLLVEDYRDAREMYAEFLQVNGLEILQAPDGPTGLAQIAVGKPDVVVLDVGLPLIGGLEVLRRIRRDPVTRTVPVIMISAGNAESFISEAISAGATMALSKPLLPAELLSAVKSVLGAPPQTPPVPDAG